ncbi:hypothetical protein SNE510_74820 [Streptomyces sp. NE5-10]|nr:hypothetical protein SNE510_74820 [Streptomyces sp. NE5-10]
MTASSASRPGSNIVIVYRAERTSPRYGRSGGASRKVSPGPNSRSPPPVVSAKLPACTVTRQIRFRHPASYAIV